MLTNSTQAACLKGWVLSSVLGIILIKLPLALNWLLSIVVHDMFMMFYAMMTKVTRPGGEKVGLCSQQAIIDQGPLLLLEVGSWGSLSSLSELKLEQLYYIVTGLSPKVHVKNLIVDKKADLHLGGQHCMNDGPVTDQWWGVWQAFIWNSTCQSVATHSNSGSPSLHVVAEGSKSTWMCRQTEEEELNQWGWGWWYFGAWAAVGHMVHFIPWHKYTILAYTIHLSMCMHTFVFLNTIHIYIYYYCYICSVHACGLEKRYRSRQGLGHQATLAPSQEDLSNIEAFAASLGWYELFQKKSERKTPKLLGKGRA